MKKHVKTASTEQEVGEVHALINKLYKRKLEEMERLIDDPNATAEDLMFGIDTRDLNAAAKWVAYNEVTAQSDATSAGSELKDQIDSITKKHSDKVLEFKKA